MNILVINHYAGSVHHGMEYRPYYLAREWVQSGHNVTIIAASKSHLRQVNPKVLTAFRTEIIDGVRYVWCRTPSYYGNGIGRVLNMLCFVTRIFQYVVSGRLHEAPDAVIASSTYPLDIYPARLIARKHKAKLVFEVHDLWPLSPVELGQISPRHPFIMLLQHAEDTACRDSDLVVSLLPRANEHLELRGMSAEKYHHIPNGAVLNGEGITELPLEHHAHLEASRKAGNFVVCYAGSHGRANALDTLLEAAKQLRGEPIMFLLVGEGPEKERLVQLKDAAKLNNVTFLPPVPKRCMPTLLSKCDILYLSFQAQPLFRYGISPNKLMDYMMAAKPVISAISAGNDPVVESKCGLSIAPEHAEELAMAIGTLINMTEEERTAMGRRGREFVEERHDYKVLAREFLELLRNKRAN